MTSSALTLHRIDKRFGSTEVLTGLDLEVPAGQMVSLLGTSGAGKSTLLRIIAGLEASDGGQVTFGGTPLAAGQVGFVFQAPVLYPHLTVEQNILFASRLKKAPALDREHFTSLVASLGLGQHLAKKPGQLSGGQAQRAGIARALVRKAPVVLFDEPLSSVDESTSAAIRTDLQELHAQLGFAGLYVTHDQNEALQMGQRVAVLFGGQVAQCATPAQLVAAPASAEVARLVFPLYNELTGEMGGRRVAAGISAFGFTAGQQPGGGGLLVSVISAQVHTAGARVDAVLEAPAELATGRGTLTLPTGTALTAVLPASFALAPGATVYLKPAPAAFHLFSPVREEGLIGGFEA